MGQPIEVQKHEREKYHLDQSKHNDGRKWFSHITSIPEKKRMRKPRKYAIIKTILKQKHERSDYCR